MTKYPWKPCTKCGSKSTPHYKDRECKNGFKSECTICARKRIRAQTAHIETPISIGHLSLTHRHKFEECGEIFACQPCPHFSDHSHDGIPRICPDCARKQAA